MGYILAKLQSTATEIITLAQKAEESFVDYVLPKLPNNSNSTSENKLTFLKINYAHGQGS
jgi:hypothetical protein